MLQTEPQTMSRKNNQGVNPLVVGVAGVIAGAAGVTALALSDKDIRKKVGKKAKEAKVSLQKWSSEKLHVLDEQEETVEKSVKESTDTTAEVLTKPKPQEEKLE